MSNPLHIVCPYCDGINRVPESRLGDQPRCGRCHKSLFEAAPMNLDDVRFDRHARRSDVPLLVDFWANWCGPCHAMAPAFAEAAKALEPRIRLAKVDTEKAPGLSARFGIRSIPTLLLVHQGKEIARQAGAMATTDIVRWTRGHLDTA